MSSIEWLDSCASTNSVLAGCADAPAGLVIATREQTAGRGQRGNTWEAQPGANLTFSLLLRPAAIPAARQFELSMIVSLAIVDTVDAVLEDAGCPLRAEIKWPNDIYVADRKICGILIENTLTGRSIDRSIVGIGLNVNQTVFLSDAPNPASLCGFTGRAYMLEPLLERLSDTEVYVGLRCSARSRCSYHALHESSVAPVGYVALCHSRGRTLRGFDRTCGRRRYAHSLGQSHICLQGSCIRALI